MYYYMNLSSCWTANFYSKTRIPGSVWRYKYSAYKRQNGRLEEFLDCYWGMQTGEKTWQSFLSLNSRKWHHLFQLGKWHLEGIKNRLKPCGKYTCLEDLDLKMVWVVSRKRFNSNRLSNLFSLFLCCLTRLNPLRNWNIFTLF